MAAHQKATEYTTTTILAVENFNRVEGFLQSVTEQALNIIVPDIRKCGGPLEFRKNATIADAFNIHLGPNDISNPVVPKREPPSPPL